MKPPGGTFRLRRGDRRDLPFLREMLVEAAHWRPEATPPATAEALRRPDLAPLLRGWGRAGDRAVLAESEKGAPLGAAWYRLWSPVLHSYGYVDPETPELVVAVRPEARRAGVGRALLTALLAEARADGRPALSLSVEPDNPARRLYEALGFTRVRGSGSAWTLVARLGADP